LAEYSGKKAVRPIGMVLHLLLMSCAFVSNRADLHSFKYLLLVLLLVFPAYMLVQLFRKQNTVFSLPPVVVAFMYVSVPCFLLVLLTKVYANPTEMVAVFSPQKVLGMIFFIWINDTGAYLVGSFLGKNKMYERISPGKTWEGAIGGVLLCIALSLVMVKIFPELSLMDWMVISTIVAVFGTLGDLVESMLKRTAGVKDSGSIMPGHGGVLDRFDSLIFSAPFVFVYLAAIGKL
ncbi:MAG: phosphatidate cytidylyltransferase, partial [Bacteroidia bacterium]